MRSRLVVPVVLLVTAAYVKGRHDGRFQASTPADTYAPPIAPAPLTDQIRMAQALAADAVELAAAQAAAAAAGTLVAEPEEAAHGAPFDLNEVLETPELVILNEWVTAPAAPRPGPTREADALDLAISAEWATSLAPPVRAAPAAPAAPALSEPTVAEAPAGIAVEIRIDETGRFSLGGFATQAGHIALCGITFQERRSGLVTPESITLVTEAANNVADGGLVVLSDAGFAPDAEGFTILLAAAGPGTFAAAGRYELTR